ncbi:MAG: hypothetical protein QXL23_02410 [Candidatus Nitrosocaldus sp.]
MIKGYATREGTSRFRARHEGKSTAIGHFKQFGEYMLTSIGMGTYLGKADDATDAHHKCYQEICWRRGYQRCRYCNKLQVPEV